jgi:hypothetical protein
VVAQFAFDVGQSFLAPPVPLKVAFQPLKRNAKHVAVVQF